MEFIEPSASPRRALLAGDLTLIESARVLLRAVAPGELTETEAADRHAHLMTATAHRHVLRISREIGDRARQPFPGELDVIHLASALIARATLPGLALLSLNERIRRASAALGLRVRPD